MTAAVPVPAGWTPTTLGALGRYVNGRGFRRGEWCDAGRPIIRIQNLTGSGERFHHFQGDVDERHVVRAGDLLVSWSATLGAYLWDGPEAVVNQHIFKVESRIDRRFHKYLLDFKLGELMRHAHGSGMVHVTRSRFHALPVAVPGPDEQRRIAGRLDGLLRRLATADAHLAAAAGNAAALVHAALLTGGAVAAAPRHALADVLAAPLANGRSVPTRDGGFPVLRLTALRSGRVDLGARKGGAWTEREARPYLVRRGDFLVSRGSGSLRLVGRGALVDTEPDPVAYPDTAVRIRARPELLEPRFLALVWDSPLVRRQIEALARTTAGIWKVNQKDLVRVAVPVPALDRQREACARADRLEAARRRLDADLATARGRSAELRRALLEAAFTARLRT
ncbi:restriction endonuclease subunit S [Dactylosporangium sp. NBC_01737]|uniref:restriction endonuclease subunit S n=1 Tax=Dactylosporangium sp. NBC_01737 TaxID=2975959 RepID=UPI002E0E336D|nr:restriction endonuclease subunit S [Dactylosporangium sp. NBC_01737]